MLVYDISHKIPLIDRYIPSLKLQRGEITDVQIYFEN